MAQAMHLAGSISTISRSGSRRIAAVGQTCWQGAGLQCRHLLGNEVLKVGPGSTWIRRRGGGSSKGASIGPRLRECSTAQANSHCRHPMQRSGFTNTALILDYLLLAPVATGKGLSPAGLGTDSWREVGKARFLGAGNTGSASRCARASDASLGEPQAGRGAPSVVPLMKVLCGALSFRAAPLLHVLAAPPHVGGKPLLYIVIM